jgi:hypothetical protein
MIVGFSSYSTGSGSGPVDYMTSKTELNRDVSPPEVVRGDSEATKRLIDSLDFKHTYTSGVLSFAAIDTVTEPMEQAIMDRFEQVAFAGLEPDQYNILWVKHQHAGHHELHFVTPRIELSTEKSLNIRPPGEGTKRIFDDFRSEINARYGFADPDDPARTRDVAVPNYQLKDAAAALRNGHQPEKDVRELVSDILVERATQGLVRCRDDVTETLRELGFEIPRQGKDYITIATEGSRWRLKGPMYAREFELERAVEAAAKDRERDYSRPDQPRAQEFSQRVDQHIEHRAQYNQTRYIQRDQSLTMESVLAVSPTLGQLAMPDFSGNRHRSISGNLEHDQLENAEGISDIRLLARGGMEAERYCEEFGKKQEDSRTLDQRGQTGSDDPHSKEIPSDTGSLQINRGEMSLPEKTNIPDTKESLENDRTGKSLTESISKTGRTITESLRTIGERIREFTGNVREYFSEKYQAGRDEQALIETSGILAKTSNELSKTDEIARESGQELERVIDVREQKAVPKREVKNQLDLGEIEDW